MIALKDGELEDVRSRVNEVIAERDRTQHKAAEKARVLEQQLESDCVQVELKLLCALENLHQLAIQREKDAMDEERKRMSLWVPDVKDIYNKEVSGRTYQCALEGEKSTCS